MLYFMAIRFFVNTLRHKNGIIFVCSVILCPRIIMLILNHLRVVDKIVFQFSKIIEQIKRYSTKTCIIINLYIHEELIKTK